MAGQSDSTMSLFSSEEIEFMAEDEMVEIVPNLRMDSLNFICGDYGPFYPQLAAQVPLWLALALKKRGKCTIRLPQWMSIGAFWTLKLSCRLQSFSLFFWLCGLENLTRVLEAERDSHAFQNLPFHYVEISRLLFDLAREDIPDMYMVRSLIEDIRDVRFHKVETNLEKFTASTVTWKNMSAMEVNVIRAFAGRALQAFYKHDNEQQTPDTDRTLDKQPQIPTDRPKRNLKPR
ncbi:DNA replication complex GINS protein PSF2-like [Populus alba x Populus x berolinensis]|uniref:DNA replication complex GINS protein PSF2 n=1 Tax=Populus alba x Populus x berolinensis TaxID=444605 RepID=A0AAD6MCQ1_9ROSI|nr:DNA replication complex GINS protein PSF2-like [Populus alba x Populus x berolinensis]